MPWFFETSDDSDRSLRLMNFNSAVGQEFLAFAPAFEATFPFGCELPEATSEETEAPTLEAKGLVMEWWVHLCSGKS